MEKGAERKKKKRLEKWTPGRGQNVYISFAIQLPLKRTELTIIQLRHNKALTIHIMNQSSLHLFASCRNIKSYIGYYHNKVAKNTGGKNAKKNATLIQKNNIRTSLLLLLPFQHFFFLSKRLPEIIGIEIPRKLLIHIHNMHIPLAIIPHHRPRPLAILFIPLNINPQAAIHFEPQQHLIVHQVPPPRRGIPFNALQFQLLQPCRQIRRLQRQPLCLCLGVAR
jgi:hypothetical protein